MNFYIQNQFACWLSVTNEQCQKCPALSSVFGQSKTFIKIAITLISSVVFYVDEL